MSGVRIEGTYRGELRMEARHGPSAATLVTDAPADNHGRGASFSPTDLVATALGTCIVTTMAIVAERHGIDLRGVRFETTKEMAADPHRRIARLPTTIHMPATLDDTERLLLERAAKGCPVHRSLAEALDAPVTFVYGDEATP